MSKEHFAGLERLATVAEAGKLRAAIDHRRVPLSDVRSAMQDLEAGRIRGKVVVCVESPKV